MYDSLSGTVTFASTSSEVFFAVLTDTSFSKITEQQFKADDMKQNSKNSKKKLLLRKEGQESTFWESGVHIYVSYLYACCCRDLLGIKIWSQLTLRGFTSGSVQQHSRLLTSWLDQNPATPC